MVDFPLSFVSFRGGILFQKTKAIITRRQVDHPSCHWLFHQFFGASSRLMTRMARPRVRFTWSLSKSGGKTGHFFTKKSSWNMERSPPPQNKKTVKDIQWLFCELRDSNLFPNCSKKRHHPRFQNGLPLSLAKKSSDNDINQIWLNAAACSTSNLGEITSNLLGQIQNCTNVKRLQKNWHNFGHHKTRDKPTTNIWCFEVFVDVWTANFQPTSGRIWVIHPKKTLLVKKPPKRHHVVEKQTSKCPSLMYPRKHQTPLFWKYFASHGAWKT